MIVPHQTDQPQPTKQKIIVNAWEIPTIQFMMNDPIRPLAPSCCEKRGIPMQRQKNPLKIVPCKRILSSSSSSSPLAISLIEFILPVPGRIKLQMKQKYARQSGRTGIAPFINEACSTKTICNFGFCSFFSIKGKKIEKKNCVKVERLALIKLIKKYFWRWNGWGEALLLA